MALFTTEINDVVSELKIDKILDYVDKNGISLYDYVLAFEDDDIVDYLYRIVEAMFQSVKNGLSKEGVIQGTLKIKRVAKSMYQQAMNTRSESDRERLFLMSYSYAVAEENADG